MRIFYEFLLMLLVGAFVYITIDTATNTMGDQENINDDNQINEGTILD